MGWTLSLFVLFLSSAYIEMTVYGIQPGYLWQVLAYTKGEPALAWLNYLSPLLLSGILWLLTDRLFYAAAVSCAVHQILSYVNTLKILYRDDPLVPKDLLLFREAAVAASDYSLKMDWACLTLISASVAGLILAGYYVKSRSLNKGIRLLGLIAMAGAVMAANDHLYSSKELFYSIEKSDPTNVTAVYEELGFTYCFLYHLNAYPIDKPEDFDKEEAEGWNEAEAQVRTPKKPPHIIFVMNEAFYDISNQARMAAAEIDPLENFNRIASMDRAVSGRIVVPNFGGGTANTEFDVMTGMQTNMISSSGASAFRIVRKNTVTLASLLNAQGYQSFFLHPGDSWFYNRQNVYRMFGIEDQIFEDAFSDEDYKGNNLAWVSDEACTDMFIREFERRREESSAPVFSYVVTIENHTAYNNNKFGDMTFPWVWTPEPLPGMAQEYLSVYLEGLRDADAMLGQLTQYFDGLDEPVILAFFGDHLPNLGADYLTYKALHIDAGKTDTIENTLKTYSPPFVVWANEEAAQSTEFLALKESLLLTHEETISANYLGAMVLQLAGYSGLSPYFDFLNDARTQLPVIWKENYRLPDGTYTNQLSESLAKLLRQMQCWEYYKLKYETIEE